MPTNAQLSSRMQANAQLSSCMQANAQLSIQANECIYTLTSEYEPINAFNTCMSCVLPIHADAQSHTE